MACLSAFVAEAERKRFQPGTWDCCLMVADWVRENTGIDGAEPWRGRYATRLGYLRHLKAGGGVEGVVSRGAGLAGLATTNAPRRGDIGIIETDQGPTAAICLGSRWMTTGRHGVAVMKTAASTAWRV